METPRSFSPLGAGRPFGFPVNTTQIPYILWRNAELPHHGGQLIPQVRGIRELLPFERTSQQGKAVFIR